jgi:hypothetical protein
VTGSATARAEARLDAVVALGVRIVEGLDGVRIAADAVEASFAYQISASSRG